jgi:ribonuclease HI
MLGRHNMKMALPPFIPTLRAHNTGNYTRVDNVFCTETIMDAIVKCDTDDATRPIKTDHFPIITQIDIYAPKAKWTPRRNFRLTDWPEFLKTLNEKLANIPIPIEITDINNFNQRLDTFSRALQDTIEKHVKLTTPSPYSKRWWSSDLANAKKLMQQLGGRSKYHRWDVQHPVHEEYRRQRNNYSQRIRAAKAEHWVEWLEGLDQSSVWQASRLVTSPATDAGKARIPTLQVKDPRTNRVVREAMDNASKGRLFHETFFPPPNPDTPSVPQDYLYPPPRWVFTNISNEQIAFAIDKLKPYKASKSNSIPNSVFTHAREVLVPHLGPLFRATYSLNYYPQEWATTETLILKKPGKPDYTSPSAWRPIVLSDGLARLLNSCQTTTMVTMCENLNILPPDHYGARPGRTTTDSIHMLTKIIKDAWRRRQVASTLFLDVKGAFPSVDVDRLIHNMRKKGIPQEYTNWMKRRLSNRKTTLIFDDHVSTTFTVENGLDQGDPFSGICYLLYNSKLTDISIKKAGERTLLFVDDAAIIVTGKDFTETHNKLRNIMNRPKGVFAWAKKHNCIFGVDKFQLLDLSRQHVPHQLNPRRRIPIPRRALMLGDQRIPSKDTAKFLGVLVDNNLNWKHQCAAALAKGQDWLIQFSRLARATQGVNAKYIRQLYLAIAVPRMLYAADIFLTPQQNVGKQRKHNRNGRAIINKLASIQRQATIMITGAMKTTATDVLEVMANLLPFHLLVDKVRHRAALRLATLPPSHPLHKPVQNAADRLVKRHPTPLHDLMHRYSIRPQHIETIKATRHCTNWKPNVKIKITTNPDDAIKEIDLDNADIKVFTDGSGLDGKIGAAAVLYRNGRQKSKLRLQLGLQRHHTVYEGEGVGAILGAKLVSREWGARTVTFYIDNHAIIKATQLTKPAPSHHLIDTLHKYIDVLKNGNHNLQITLKWVPGHKGVEGNELADEQAKKAITEGSSNEHELPVQLKLPLPRSKSAILCAYYEKLKRKAHKMWQKSPRFGRMHKTDPTSPSKAYVKLIAGLPRRIASTLTQLRTGHAQLAKHLHRIKRADSPICPACLQGVETIQHLILHCPAHHIARQVLRNNTGGRDINVTKLFTTRESLRALFKFIAATGRFHRNRGNAIPPD